VAAIEDAKKVCLQHGAKVFGRSLFNRFKRADAGVVNENVEAAEFFDRVVDERFNLIVIAHVASETDRAPIATLLIQLIDRLIDFVLMPSANADGYAFADQRFSDPAADTLRAASDDCVIVF